MIGAAAQEAQAPAIQGDIGDPGLAAFIKFLGGGLEGAAAGFQQQDVQAAVRQRQRQADAGRAAADNRQIGRQGRVPGKGACVLKGAQKPNPFVTGKFSPVPDAVSAANVVACGEAVNVGTGNGV